MEEVLFSFLTKYNIAEDIKGLIYQVVTDNQDYLPPPYLRLEHQYMQTVGLWNLWYRFIPLSMLPLFNKDILMARKMCKRLINLLVRQLHRLWIQWCLVIYAKVSDKVIIEELVELKEEI